MPRATDSLAHRAARALAGISDSAPRNPVFVIGCGRSGTTMLRRLLAGHPSLAVFPSEGNELWLPNVYPWHSRRVDVPVFWADPERFTRIAISSTSDRQWRRLRSTFGHYQRLRRAPVFVNKSAMIHFMLDRAVELFPDARFVHVVRDGRAVSLSWMTRVRRRDAGLGGGPADGMDDVDLLEALIRYWAASLAAVDASVRRLALGADRILEIGYETLCASPARTLGRLARFLAVDEAPLLAHGTSHYVDQNAKALALAPEVLDSLGRIARAGLESRSYSLESVGSRAPVS